MFVIMIDIDGVEILRKEVEQLFKENEKLTKESESILENVLTH